MRIRAVALVALLAAFCALACGGDSKPAGTPGATFTAVAGTPPASVLEVLEQVERIRGLAGAPGLKVAVVSRNDVRALLEHTLTAEDRAHFAATTTLYQLLGFLPQGQEYLGIYLDYAEAAVIGLYQPSEKTLYVVTEGGRNLDDLDDNERVTLAHELTHALQDAAFDIGVKATALQPNLDASLAFTAAIEGDAVTTQRLWDGRSGRPAVGAAILFARTNAFAGAPAAIDRELRFPYEAGADWVRSVRDKGGFSAVDVLLKNPPAATSVILHPEIGTTWKPAAVALPDIAEAIGEGWARESGGTLGEFLLRNFLQQRIKALDASEGAAGWSGDHYDVYRNGGASIVVQRLQFLSPPEREEYVAALTDWLKASGASTKVHANEQVSTFEDGRELIVAPGTTETEVLLAIGSSTGPAAKAIELVRQG